MNSLLVISDSKAIIQTNNKYSFRIQLDGKSTIKASLPTYSRYNLKLVDLPIKFKPTIIRYLTTGLCTINNNKQLIRKDLSLNGYFNQGLFVF